ncbi:hypothetical protein DEJ16_03620 [Curtobacterium sp. MCJR17_055]|uniref:hypothetical protein n=1 Tax=unclassified Curtobacterium TaxID=257496 RepID=UPI000D88F711|nr:MULTISPECIES: hypothetical protein [unclassified Curtobacterium]PYY33771.1 hypothetical protein DEI87_10940 [Curtobacterium sp. MCBD17_029]PYY58759.1 hypothetical protein DEJ16_03620 [Curtobacterium sp. MCJR17_055]PYY59700.1 hypothetical protein DEJ26_07285 [Curtobacterium sp. MCPF17_015]WIB36362.1 hypothetical protein DEJ15_04170 [Curtobacterium sp. MCJR17_043]
MPDPQSPRFEPIPLRLLSLTAQFDAVVWPALVGMTFTNSTGPAILQRHVTVRASDDRWTFSLLNGTQLIEPADPLVEAATQVMNVLQGLRSMGRGGEAAGPADV